MSAHTVELVVNGKRIQASTRGVEFLTEFLRERLGLVGTKVGCGVGVCGLCTVWLDGRIVSGCLIPVVAVQGCEVWTVEGLARLAEEEWADVPPGLPPPALVRAVLESFLACEGLQCGICTAGQVWGVCSLLMEDPRPSEEKVREYLAGNLCRCTGYEGILRAAQKAADEWRRWMFSRA